MMTGPSVQRLKKNNEVAEGGTTTNPERGPYEFK
jgi:hypothetical protein